MFSALRVLRERIVGLFAPGRRDLQLDQELRFHIDELTEENLHAGMTPEEARRQAVLAIGGMQKAREEFRDAAGIPVVRDLAQDVRYALRGMRKNPAFTAVAVLTLALGVGANTAIFSAVNALVLRELPFKDPERLAVLFEAEKNFRVDVLRPDRKGLMSASVPMVRDWQAQTGVFDDVGAVFTFSTPIVLTGPKDPEEIKGGSVTPNYFSVLGLEPRLGRFFVAGEDRPGRDDVMILSHSLWRRRFSGAPDIAGKQAVVNGRNYTIVGVLPPEFESPQGEQAWIPYVIQPDPAKQRRTAHNLQAIARLKNGVSIERARAALETLAAVRAREFPENKKYDSASVVPLRDYLLGDTRSRLLLLFGATGFIVLIACANLASMLLTRGESRAREMALRAALGAGRFRLIRQAMVETITLAVLGCLAGLALAFWMSRGIIAIGTTTLPQLANVRLDWRVMSFALGVSVAAGLFAGVVPFLRAGRRNVCDVLKDGRGDLGVSILSRRVGRLLVVAELAAALLLLTGAGLMVNTLARLDRVDLGFEPDRLLTLRITLPRYKYASSPQRPGAARQQAFFEQALERLHALPDVRSVGMTNVLPFSGVQWGTTITAEGRPGGSFLTHTRSVTPGYFETMHIALLSGRDFNAHDTADAPRVVIVNDTLARQIWPNEDPIGKRINPKGTTEVVGVVAGIRHQRLDLGGGPELYAPLAQAGSNTMFVAVRTGGDPARLAAAVRSEIWRLDKEQPVEDVRTMDDQIALNAAPRRFYAVLLCIFAGIAVALAAVGTYGVISYSVSRRRNEIGIRMALGARRGDVMWLVVRQGLLLAAIGVAVGVAGALAATRALTSMLYGVRPADPLTFGAVSLLLAIVALAACYVPARRAARVDVILALRAE